MKSSTEDKVTIPSDQVLLIETNRLFLEPIKKEHSDEMVRVLSNSELYAFIPQEPPVLSELKVRYEKWQSRCSPDQSELWLNWVARRKNDSKLVGHFQAGYQQRDQLASVAYTVGKEFQRQGYAAEALASMTAWLREELKPISIKAWVDTRNEPSIRLLLKLGFEKTELLKAADFFKGSESDEFVFVLKNKVGRWPNRQ